MAIEDFIRAIPKVELRVRLEGVFRKDTLMLIAEQNDVPSNIKKFENWVALLDDPDYQRLSETIQTVGEWAQHPDDLTRLVYDLGVILARQNIKYAEVIVDPLLHMQPTMSFDKFMETLNDGRDRAERGWKIKLRWILNIRRDQPRRADEIVRWAASSAGTKGGVVAVVLSGDETAQPVGQFVRPFATAHKKEVARVIYVGDQKKAETIPDVVEELQPNRLLDARGIEDSPESLTLLEKHDIVLNMCPTRALRMGWIDSYDAHPVRSLYDNNVKLTISADMPSYFQTTLSDEYIALVTHNGFTRDEIEELVLNSIRHSFMNDDEKEEMLSEFKKAFEHLRMEYIMPETLE